MKFLVDEKFPMRTVDEVYNFVKTRPTPTKVIKIILTEIDQSIENAIVSTKILKLMLMTKEHCNVDQIVVDFEFEGAAGQIFSVSLKKKESETKEEPKKEKGFMDKIFPYPFKKRES